jgi:type IX secretion system substrate protein
MFGFYRVIGRFAGLTTAIALLTVFAAADATAQIAWPTEAHPRAMAFTTDGGNEVQLIGTHSFGVYKSVPGAIGKLKWNEANSGLTIPLVVNDIAVLANGTVLMGTWGRDGLYTSADAGATWTAVASTAFDTLAVNSVQAIAESTVDGLIYLSADDGNVFFSQDSGTSWKFNGRLPAGAAGLPWSLLADPDTAKEVYAGTFGRGVFKSADNGGFWSEFTNNTALTDTTGSYLGTAPGGNYVFDMEFDPADNNRLYIATSRGVWTMSDVTSGSSTWARVGNGTFTLLDGTTLTLEPEVRSIAFNAAGTLYMATWGFGVLTNSAPTGSTAHTQFVLRGGQVSIVAVSPNGDVFAASDTGVHNIAASATAVDPETGLPETFSLGQNYPNPFNPTTSITFDLPAQSDVSISVFDVLGRRVAQLANGVYAAGTHAVTLDASRLQSGLYIYRLDAGDRSLVRTMSLVK